MKARALNLLTIVVLLGLFGPIAGYADTLVYWGFNNNSTAYTPPSLGSFATSSAAYGEQYTSATYQLSGNTTSVYGSSSYIDFTNLTVGVNNAVINGFVSGSTTTHAQTNTAFGGFGVFQDVTGGTGGSFIIMNPSTSGVGTETGHYVTLCLSSLNFSGLQLSYDTRVSSGFTLNEGWSYSLDGSVYNTISTVTVVGAGAFVSKSVVLPTELDNQSVVYVRMTLSGNGGSAAFDNLTISGSAVPEPNQMALLFGGLALLCLHGRKFSRGKFYR